MMKSIPLIILSVLLWHPTTFAQQSISKIKLGPPGKKSVNSFDMPYSFSDLVAHGISVRIADSDYIGSFREISWGLERVSVFPNLDSIGHGEGYVPFVGAQMGIGFLPLKLKVTASDFSEKESEEITGLVQTALGRLFGVVGENSENKSDLYMDLSVLQVRKERERNNFSDDLHEIDVFNFIALNLQKTLSEFNVGSSNWQLYVRGEGTAGTTRRELISDSSKKDSGSHLNLTGCGGFDFAKSSYRVAGEVCYERKRNKEDEIELGSSTTYQASLIGTHTQSPIELRLGYEDEELENGQEDKRVFIEAKYHLR